MEHNIEVNQSKGGSVSSEIRTNTELQYAGFWIRFVAVLLDGIAIQAVFVLLSFIVNISPFKPNLGMSVLQYAISWSYSVILTVLLGQTLGKMIMGIRVIRKDGLPNTWGSILLREIIGKIVSTIILCIGYIMAGIDSEKRGLHDRMAGTRVVKK
ncbi:putative membrane protein YteJ [Paenibacillus marchantiophytorum]|uniref:Membrane protein YteJ n=1 Tax=Paenibacillus marchantiophytorum TaxID=1619310 RepID=A0ABQ1F9M2_9BACL|nr:RDD family protein [Paenibacillus marchantiophytorum]GGA03456.1 putative membrane protein YteJ [Paenibacillus marchantiophytorum]